MIYTHPENLAWIEKSLPPEQRALLGDIRTSTYIEPFHPIDQTTLVRYLVGPEQGRAVTQRAFRLSTRWITYRQEDLAYCIWRGWAEYVRDRAFYDVDMDRFDYLSKPQFIEARP